MKLIMIRRGMTRTKLAISHFTPPEDIFINVLVAIGLTAAAILSILIAVKLVCIYWPI
jgi:hypothetical protein